MPTMDTVFYDGHCGLCHRWVKFVMPRDRDGSRFVFAPLQGPTFAEAVPETRRKTLPDSIIVQTADGELLTRSDAVRHILRRLGGFWGFCGGLMGVVPRAIRDWGYDRVAAIRHRFFARPNEACPLMPPELRQRFRP
jgi:predicted DCC family thiol-disulfide oxidoreductase YuxK